MDTFDIDVRMDELKKNSPALTQIYSEIPKVMGELTSLMISEQDVRFRERIKRMMKGLLDMVTADTKYPPKQEAVIKNSEDGEL